MSLLSLMHRAPSSPSKFHFCTEIAQKQGTSFLRSSYPRVAILLLHTTSEFIFVTSYLASQSLDNAEILINSYDVLCVSYLLWRSIQDGTVFAPYTGNLLKASQKLHCPIKTKFITTELSLHMKFPLVYLPAQVKLPERTCLY